MLDNVSTTSSKKVSVQRKSDGEPLGIALWIGGEALSHLPENFEDSPLLLESEGGTGRLDLEGVEVQKAGERVLGLALWIPGSKLPDLAGKRARISCQIGDEGLLVEVVPDD